MLLRIGIVSLTTTIGILCLVSAVRRASAFTSPWRWLAGMTIVGLSFIVWPFIYIALTGRYLGEVWILVWSGTALTLAYGARLASSARLRAH